MKQLTPQTHHTHYTYKETVHDFVFLLFSQRINIEHQFNSYFLFDFTDHGAEVFAYVLIIIFR